jgi:hypothetical protein
MCLWKGQGERHVQERLVGLCRSHRRVTTAVNLWETEISNVVVVWFSQISLNTVVICF